jgi:hypothetical protein
MMRWFAAALAFGLVALPAQQISIAHTEGERSVCSVQVVAYGGAPQIGGCGWLVVDAQNHDSRPHALALQFSSANWADHAIAIDRSIGLGPLERTRFWLPLPNGVQTELLARIRIDATAYHEMVRSTASAGVVGLLLSDRPQQQVAALALLQAVAAAEKPEVRLCASPDAPADWRLFTGFQVVLVDGRCPLRADVQEALRRYVHAGGQVLVADPAALPAGAVREALSPLLPSGSRRHGLGAWLAAGEFDGATAERLLGERPRLGQGLWPLSDDLCGQQFVPGLGEAPVLVFLAVMLAFAVIAGPVNFVWLRRRRRPLLALVTVPVLGFGTTALMVGYGAFHDGFGVRGVVRSWTLLDQQDHEATTIAARTLFAGLSPGALALDGDSVLFAKNAIAARWLRGADRWSYDADRSRLDGAVLPSRTPTPLLSVQQGVVRERLQVRLGDRGLEVLADGGIEPLGEMLVRLPDGSHWTGQAPLLHSCDAAEAERVFDGLQRDAGTHVTRAEPDPRYRYRRDPGEDGERTVHNVSALTAAMCGARELPRGAWFARIARTPWDGDHGLRIDYDGREHFVVGVFAAEDVLR